MLILAMPGAGKLAAQLAVKLECDWSEVALHRFPDGESLVRIDVPLKGRFVVVAAPLEHPDDKTLPLLFTADAARELGAMHVGLVAPYLPYMRQDIRFHAGEALTSRSYARLVSGSFDFLVTVDPHLHRWHALCDLYPIRTSAVASAPAIAQWLRRNVRDALLVGPDSESGQWVSQVASLALMPWTTLAKARRGDRDVTVRIERKLHGSSLQPVLLDDIVSTGATLANAARALKRAGMGPPVCVAIHALFEAGAMALLADAGITRVVTCDTVAHPSNRIGLAPHIAKALRALARGHAGAAALP